VNQGEQRLLTADEVADILGMGRDWVYAEVRAGRLPHVKLGRYVRFREASITAWLAELERAAPEADTGRVRSPRQVAPRG
jgi:excisionase family DNA binding protein